MCANSGVGTGIQADKEQLPRQTVVLADDEPHVRAYLKSLAHRLSLEVVGEAANGLEAARLAREKRPDLVLLDLNMPIRTGEEAMQEILADNPSAKIIILSAVADRILVERCRELGATHFILKDSPFEEILEIIRDTVGR
jgi:two-component system chemotaxis response regulator CheY